MSKTGTDKSGLQITMINRKYAHSMGHCANRELFIQFLTRIYNEIPGCKIGNFSKLKALNASNFGDFRLAFRPKLLSLFIMPAYTFENLHSGKFPIGFHIWDCEQTEKFKHIKADVYDENGKLTGKKTFECYDDVGFMTDWLITTRGQENEKQLAFMSAKGNDFQNADYTFIVNEKDQLAAPRGTWVTDKNLIECCIYLAVRHCISPTWLNDRDQFLFPNDGWETDAEFQNDCLILTLFHTQNRISYHKSATESYINNWIPFTEREVKAKDKFASNFMSKFLKERIKTAPLSVEAKTVYDAGLDLWRYYHKSIKDNRQASVNASYSDIKAFFQGRDEKGRVKSSSSDETYTALLMALRESHKALNAKIVPKVYEYGFLRK
jgi:hypothetical protein